MDRIKEYFERVEPYLDHLDSNRIVYTFVVVWAVAGVVWIVLDWLGNPNRGGFKPTRDIRVRGFRERMAHRRLKKAESDADVRATLRDAYGVSSLRAVWNRNREARTLVADNLLVRELPPSTGVRTRRRVLARLRDVRPGDDGAVELLLSTLDDTGTTEPAEPAALRARGRWRPGDDPLKSSSDGRPPSSSVLRRRVWKNHAGDPVWGSDNQARMRAGKPPVRLHPVHGEQTAFVNLVSVRPCWPDTALDPFARPADNAMLPAPAPVAGPVAHDPPALRCDPATQTLPPGEDPPGEPGRQANRLRFPDEAGDS